MAFDPVQYQPQANGPLSPALVARIVALKNRTGVSYATLGDKLGFSGTFLHHIVNRGVNVGTQHVERIVRAVEALEDPDSAVEAPAGSAGMLRHSFHLRPDLQIAIDLPADLTEREAERLARFVQSLPVA